MRASADVIWRVPAYLPYLQPPLTETAIIHAEYVIGYRLPNAYLDLLRKQNGGYIRFELPNIPHRKIAGLGPHYPNLTDFDWEEDQEYVDYPLKGLVPFDGDGHWYLCLDYRSNSKSPTITFADIECNEESYVAGSFDEYLGMLRFCVVDGFVLEGVGDIEAVKRELSRRLGTSFETLDDRDRGYSSDRARLPSTKEPEWLWISPNSVRRGFVRPDDPRYSALREEMPGFADRFPLLPPNCYILSTTSGAQTHVRDACTQAGLVPRPLSKYYADR